MLASLSRLILAATAVVALGAPSLAHATTGLAWQWTSPQRYHMVARVHVPLLANFAAEQNHEFRAAEYQVELVTRCEPIKPLGKSGWELKCDFEDVALNAVPAEKYEPEKAVAILEEMDARLEAGWAQITFSADGRVKNLDLEGVEKGNTRTSTIHEAMRQMLLRAFASLDHELPSKGDDKGKGTWRTGGLLATTVPSKQGTVGVVQIAHVIDKTEGSVVSWNSSGKGVVTSGETVMVGGVEKPVASWDMSYQGFARFDTARGLLLERELIVEGQPTASSLQTEGMAGHPYVLAARVVLLTDEVKPVLPASGPALPTASR